MQVPEIQAVIRRVVGRVLARRTRDLHCIEDVCQNVSVILLRKQDELGAISLIELEKFVGCTARNQFITATRRRRTVDWQDGFEEASVDEDPSVVAEQTDQFILLFSLLDRLPRQFRQIVRMRIVDGWTYGRIAEETGVPVNTCKTLFRRAKLRLAKAVKQSFAN